MRGFPVAAIFVARAKSLFPLHRVIHAPGTGTGEGEIEKHETIENREVSAIDGGIE